MKSIRCIVKDSFPGLSHWVGVALSFAALVTLLVLAGGRPWHVIGFSVYGATLVLLWQKVPATGLAWLALGGLIYSLGAVIFLTDRPHLWPGRFAAHDLWHVMVLAGSACHFVTMVYFVVPAG